MKILIQAFAAILASTLLDAEQDDKTVGCVFRGTLLSYELIEDQQPYSSFHFERYSIKVEVKEILKGYELVELGEILSLEGYLGPSDEIRAKDSQNEDLEIVFLLSQKDDSKGIKRNTLYNTDYYYREIIKEIIVEQVSPYNFGHRSATTSRMASALAENS